MSGGTFPDNPEDLRFRGQHILSTVGIDFTLLFLVRLLHLPVNHPRCVDWKLSAKKQKPMTYLESFHFVLCLWHMTISIRKTKYIWKWLHPYSQLSAVPISLDTEANWRVILQCNQSRSTFFELQVLVWWSQLFWSDCVAFWWWLQSKTDHAKSL